MVHGCDPSKGGQDTVVRGLGQGMPKLTGENLKLVWVEFSTVI
jgi:hypothetical protein